MKKIQVHKRETIKSIARVRKPNKLVKINKPTHNEQPRKKIVKQRPANVVIPSPKRASVKSNDRIRVQKTIEAVKQNSKKIIRLNKKIKKDANYNKIAELRDCGIGKILVMMACGPSILENDFSVIKNIDNVDIMVINKPLKSVWPPKYWAFCDNSQYIRNKDSFNQYNGLLINSSSIKARKPNQILITPKQTTGVSRNLHEGYVIGRSSVYANIQTAIWMNYDRIFVFGVDMCAVNGKLHYYGVNPDVEEKTRLERFKGEANNYSIMAKKLPDKIRKKIYFCSKYNNWPFVYEFNKLDHIVALKEILQYASDQYASDQNGSAI